VCLIPLKRTVSILLLVVFLFNVGGYYLVYLGLHHRSDRLLSKKIEADDYNESETIELKIPVTLPYPIQQNGFERVDGRFEHNGNFYKLIKQKLENDTVYIVCIRDIDSKKLAKTFKDYVAKTNDLPASSKNTLNFFGKFLKDFETLESDLVQHFDGMDRTIVYPSLTFPVIEMDRTPTGPPPEA
jgi:hypothetical protein